MIANLTPISLVINHFEKVDPKIAKVLEGIDLNAWFEDKVVEDHFLSLTRNIIYQQLAGKAASTIFKRFQDLVGQINPENVLNYDVLAYRSVGLSNAKGKYVLDLAQQVQDGTVELANLDTLDNESVVNELTKVKGIGRWTAEMFLLFTLHRENVFSYGDLGLKNGFAKLYELDSPSLSQIKDVVSKWAPYESYGSISLWHYLDNS